LYEVVTVSVDSIPGVEKPERKMVNIYDLEGKPIGRVKLPEVFYIPVRKDLVKRAYLSAFTAKLQPQGRDPMAGKRTTAESLGVGYGLARIPREKGRRRGRFVTSTVGGRSAHAPTVEKKLHEEINKKERILALASAIAATAIRKLIAERGHKVDKVPQVPVVVDDNIANIEKTNEIKKVLKKLGLWDDIRRSQVGTRIRAGKGKMRGRRYYTPKSILIITHEAEKLYKAARNLPGVDVITPDNLNMLYLAPGMKPGRLTLYTKSALKAIGGKFKVTFI